MIVIDMDIPKCCGTCRMSGTDVCNEWTNLKGYDMGQKRANTCPIKCDIEDIKAEIEAIEIQGQVDEHTMFIRSGEQVRQMALDIIDKYKEQTK